MPEKFLDGTIKISAKGTGFVVPDSASGGPASTAGKRPDPDDSIEIAPTDLNTALPGDRVRVRLNPRVRSDELQTGAVTEILLRKRLRFVGLLEQENNFFYLVPDDRRVYKDILLPAEKLAGARPGDKVLVKVSDWRDPKKDPLGEVVTVIGRAGEHETEMLAIVYERGFSPSGFPEAVEREAAGLKQNSATDLAAEIPRRRDCRQILTFTIDPADAKDFDDAISIRELPPAQGGPAGGWEGGVHIADVAHFVQPETALDAEARERATSIYLVDRTIPMLPEVLSNDLCSLKPNEDKLTFSAIFTFDRDWKQVDRWFGRTVIHSAKRFTYEEAQAALNNPTAEHHAELTTLNQLAYHLRKEKMAAGAIAFETTEIKFRLDERGRPLEVIKKERTDSHLLIEDLMLLANRQVAEYVSSLVGEEENHFVYRVHDKPDEERIKQLANFLAPLGYKIKIDSGGISAKSINELLRSVAGTPEENMVETATMRSMAKAVYSLRNIGHYGLAFNHYTHFTSPIRRYPDVMVHRLLDHYLRKEKLPDDLIKDYNQLVIHASAQELAAQEAERESVRYKQAEFLAERVGQIFDGVISGLAKWGIFIQEQTTLAEGMVRLSELGDDFYVFDEQKYAMTGQRTGKRYRLGDRVRVKLLRADPRERQLDFVFV